MSLSSDLPLQSLTLRFFDLDVIIKSDSDPFLDGLARLYPRFRIAGGSLSPQSLLKCAVLTGAENGWGRPVMILDDEVWPLTRPQAGYIHQTILAAILARVRSHILIHAGVVSTNGQGLLLVADSFHGKTTLVLELVRRGFEFLTDETAALGRVDRLVHPFPRTLRVRTGTLELIGRSEAGAGAAAWLGKYLVDIEDIRPDSLGQAAPVSHVIILQDPAEAAEDRPTGPDRELNILFDRFDETLLTAIHRIDGVGQIDLDEDRDYTWLRLRTIRRTAIFSRIEALCREQQVLILDVTLGRSSQPAFTRPARLEPIPTSQAVVELLRRFQSGPNAALLQDEFKGSSTRLFMEAAAIVGQADCYRLEIGPLPEMADFVSNLVKLR